MAEIRKGQGFIVLGDVLMAEWKQSWKDVGGVSFTYQSEMYMKWGQ